MIQRADSRTEARVIILDINNTCVWTNNPSTTEANHHRLKGDSPPPCQGQLGMSNQCEPCHQHPVHEKKNYKQMNLVNLTIFNQKFHGINICGKHQEKWMERISYTNIIINPIKFLKIVSIDKLHMIKMNFKSMFSKHVTPIDQNF